MATETEVPMVVEVDCTTGESITRAMTKDEQETHKKMAEDAAVRRAEQEAAAQAEADAKASALTKLTVLGLTVEEAKALLK
jgi:membrane protein involved in colicin uptake